MAGSTTTAPAPACKSFQSRCVLAFRARSFPQSKAHCAEIGAHLCGAAFGKKRYCAAITPALRSLGPKTVTLTSTVYTVRTILVRRPNDTHTLSLTSEVMSGQRITQKRAGTHAHCSVLHAALSYVLYLLKRMHMHACSLYSLLTKTLRRKTLWCNLLLH